MSQKAYENLASRIHEQNKKMGVKMTSREVEKKARESATRVDRRNANNSQR